MEIPRSVSGFKYCDLLTIFGPSICPRNYLEANKLKLKKGECLVGSSVEAPDKLAKERTLGQGLQGIPAQQLLWELRSSAWILFPTSTFT